METRTRNRSKANKWVVLLLALLFLLSSGLTATFSHNVYRVFLAATKEVIGKTLVFKGWDEEHINMITIYHQNADEELLKTVAEVALEEYWRLARYFDDKPGSVSIVLHPSRDSLRGIFGWSEEDKVLGAYWAGAVHILDPQEWAGDDPLLALKERGPILHEMSHYFLDYWAAGAFPLWFSEGLAQYLEWYYKGYYWQEALREVAESDPYSLEELRGFEQLSNQPLAYGHSFLIVFSLAQTNNDPANLLAAIEDEEDIKDLMQEYLNFEYAHMIRLLDK